MANYYGSARSNYFKVKDPDAFKAWAQSLSCVGVWNGENGSFGIYSDCPDSGCWPSTKWVDDEPVDIDLEAELAEHLQEGEVAILMQCGAEKLRYVSGYAIAVNHLGETVSVCLAEIYKLAKAKFGTEPTQAEY